MEKSKDFLIRIIIATHLTCVGFLVFGWLLPKPLLLFHIITVPITVIQWWLNNNQCILTQWQYRLAPPKEDVELEGAFVKNLMTKVGLELSDGQLTVLLYGILAISLSLSIWRLY